MPKERIKYIDIFFIILIITYIVLGQILVWNISYVFPFGGPDEIMHISMAEYIAKHLSWPNWDSKELLRNAYGVSYSSGSAIVYWLHGLTYKLFSHHRLGSFILLLVYLGVTSFIYKKSKVAGFFLLAALFPQALFIFSYVNSDCGTIISALFLGMSVGAFLISKDSVKNFLILFFFAGFAVTSRQHLWAIAFITLVWAVIYKYKTILKFDKKIWLIALIVALIPASWWFITSYLANDGDILGVFTSAKSIAKFSKAGLPSLGRDWSDFSLKTFFLSTIVGVYGNWGWLAFPLKNYEYILIVIVITFISYYLYKIIPKKIFLFLVFLIIINFIFMIIYSVFYDYQAQGRYLYPSIYVTVGIITITLLNSKNISKNLFYLLILLSTLNIFFSIKLALNSYLYLEKPVLIKYENENYYKKAAFHIDRLKVIDNKFFIRGWAFNLKNGRVFNNLKLILKNGNKYYKVDLEVQERKDVAKAFKSQNIVNSGFNAEMIDIKGLPKGNYKCLLSAVVNNKDVLIDCKKSIKIK